MNITDEIIEATLSRLGDNFDSHKVILELAHNNQALYVSELVATQSDIPFQVLHSKLGRRIKVVCERLGFTGTVSRSNDIFGQYSECMHWSR